MWLSTWLSTWLSVDPGDARLRVLSNHILWSARRFIAQTQLTRSHGVLTWITTFVSVALWSRFSTTRVIWRFPLFRTESETAVKPAVV